ncbi:MAG: 5'/3'-nucleotidase SurE [Candidatus Firestonebacteria bacterium]
MSILVTNDDGVHSEGLHFLANFLKKLGKVCIVAPDKEKSAASHSLTLIHPLRVVKISKNVFSVDGTPTDCVIYAVRGLLKNKRPDLVVAGINKGANLGDDITYSGTVSAAMEGALLGIPSVSFSMVGRKDYCFDAAEDIVVNICSKVLKNGLPKDTLLNVNIPNLPKEQLGGIMITRQGKRIYRDTIVKKQDPRGNNYYWIGGEEPIFEQNKNTDFYAIQKNMVSVTPLHLDLTDEDALKVLKKWKL